jgi:hypothetical protein
LNEENNEDSEFKYNNENKTTLFKKARTIFVLEDESVYGLQDMLSMVRNRVIIVKRTFYGILVDIECDIICVSSYITPQSK